MAPTNNSTTWVTSRTWVAGELVTASIMNAHVRDQLNAIKTPAGGYSTLNLGADLTIASTTFTDMDATNLALTFTTGGGDVLLGFFGTIGQSGSNQKTYFDVHESVAGTRIGGDDGLIEMNVTTVTTDFRGVSFVVRISSLPAASHTFKMQWKNTASTSTFYAGAGTAGLDIHPQMWAVEL